MGQATRGPDSIPSLALGVLTSIRAKAGSGTQKLELETATDLASPYGNG